MTERILQKFKQIEQIGMNGVLAHWLMFSNNPIIDTKPWTACWTGGDYFRWNFNEPLRRWKEFDVKLQMDQLTDILEWKDGLYHFYFETNELHYGCIYIFDTQLLVCNTYGGTNHICIGVYDKQDWLQMFVSNITSKTGSYFTFLKLFSIPYDTLDISLKNTKDETSITGRMIEFEYTYIPNPTCWLYDGDFKGIYEDVLSNKISGKQRP